MLSCWVDALKTPGNRLPGNPEKVAGTKAGICAPPAPLTLYWIVVIFSPLQSSWLSVRADEINSIFGPSATVIVPPFWPGLQNDAPGVEIV